MSDSKTLYDDDFVAWTEQQAEALRSAALGNTNQPLDWENLAEEIESLGRSDKRELRSQIYGIIRHLVKLQFSAVAEPSRGWRESIRDGRREAEVVVADSPSLKPLIGQFVVDETRRAIKRAISDPDEYGEIDPATEGAILQARHTADQVLGDDWFPPEPAAARSGE